MSIPASIRSFVDELADDAPTAYDDLRAVVFNGSLKRSPEPSHTDGLLDVATATMRRLGVRVDIIRTADHEIPPGVWPDMREQGYAARRLPRAVPGPRRAGRHRRARQADLARRPAR